MYEGLWLIINFISFIKFNPLSFNRVKKNMCGMYSIHFNFVSVYLTPTTDLYNNVYIYVGMYPLLWIKNKNFCKEKFTVKQENNK